MITVLNKIDEEVNWSNSYFTTLEAEVVVEKSGSSRPKIARDLVAAIRDDHKTRTFILIGDPGSGKVFLFAGSHVNFMRRFPRRE